MWFFNLLSFWFWKGQIDLFSFHIKHFFPVYFIFLEISNIISFSAGDLYRNCSNSRKQARKARKIAHTNSQIFLWRNSSEKVCGYRQKAFWMISPKIPFSCLLFLSLLTLMGKHNMNFWYKKQRNVSWKPRDF